MGSCFSKCQCPTAYLYAFDFDRTIIDQNSDLAVIEVIKNPIPQDIQRVYDGSNWADYMDKMFRYVHEQGGSMEKMAERIQLLRLSPGMDHLLHRIAAARLSNYKSELLIISDSNSFFINTFVHRMKSPIVPDFLITNYGAKAKGPEAYLKLKPYDRQTTCPFCPMNLCKGKALVEYIEERGPFTRVFYTADGGNENDVCPGMHLSENDILFVRKGYAMERIIQAGTWKGKLIIIKARIVYWDNAKQIESEMEF